MKSKYKKYISSKIISFTKQNRQWEKCTFFNVHQQDEKTYYDIQM